MIVSKKCQRRGADRVRYRITPHPGSPSWKRIEATLDGRVIGSLRVALVQNRMEVLGIEVVPILRRCGIGTGLYQRMADWGCKNNKWLKSGVSRSRYAQGFWSKQERKGRAVCIAKKPDGGCWEYMLKDRCPRGLRGIRR